MPDTTTKKTPATVSEDLQAQKDLQLFYLFSTTLLSTMRLNKLLHLVLSSFVCEENALFCRAMLFLYNQKTNTLQGMLGICREGTDGLQLAGTDPANPLSGYWDLDEETMASQRQSEFCAKVRKTRIDLAEGCKIVSNVVNDRRLYRVEDVQCLNCQECGFITRFGISSFAAVPLLTSNNLIGIIIVDNPLKHKPITNQQIQVLQLFANQAGMAIENARLYRDLEEAHSELRDARQRLIHGAHLAAIGEMAASISHELKTPLITIGGFAARLGRMMPENTSQRHCLDTIISESHRLERLLGDILAFSRKPTICYQECDLAETVKSCLADYAGSLEERNITLMLVIPARDWIVLGDGGQLKQVCINLIINAQEAINRDGTLGVSFSTVEERGKVCAVVSFTDSGGGIPEDVLNKIFTPFFTTKRHGTGLGLSIVNRIVQNHDGIMKVHNVSTGAEFQVVLPLVLRS